MAAGAVLGVTLAGCYTLQPLRVPDPVPNTNVVARLTDQGAMQLAPVLGGPADRVEGVVQSTGPEGLTLAVTRVEYRDGRAFAWRRESLLLPPATVGWVADRKLNRPRSYLAAVGIAAGAILLARIFGIGSSADRSTQEPPSQPPN